MKTQKSGRKDTGIRLGIVIPLANEESTIHEFVRRLFHQVGDRDRVFFILDRVSKDKTRKILAEYAKSDPRAVVVWAPEDTCVVDAYFRGYREALRAGCCWILEMDGGLSHLPEEIPRFIARMEEGYDFVAGSRFIRGARYGSFSYRYIVSRGGTILTNLLLGTKMRDMTSGFECFSNRALAHTVEHGVLSRAHFFQTEIRALLHDWKWVEVPITYSNPSARLHGSSVREALRCLYALYRERRQQAKEE